MRLHRIGLAEYSRSAAEAYSGRGGLYGKGRWNSLGHLIVYSASSISLAMAEVLVHVQRSTDLAPYNRWEIEIPDRFVAPVPSLPSNWAHDQAQTRKFGDAWLAAASSPAILVPSAIVPVELNCLINPLHPDFSLAWVQPGPIPFTFDPRLTKP